MRFAGTAIQYSKKAMPQEKMTAIHSGDVAYFRCPYQANVMKTFEPISSRMGRTLGESSMSMKATRSGGRRHVLGLAACPVNRLPSGRVSAIVSFDRSGSGKEQPCSAAKTRFGI